MNNYVQNGNRIDVVLAAGITGGTPLLIGAMLGIAMATGVTGDTVSFTTDGVFALAKNTGEAFTQGQKLYWDNTNSRLTGTATSNTYVGLAWTAQGSSDQTANIRLSKS